MDLLAEPYLWKWPKRGPGRGNAKQPIDKNNDGMKALAYKIVDRYGTVNRRDKPAKKARQSYWLAHDSLDKAVKKYAGQRAHSHQGRTYRARTGRLY